MKSDFTELKKSVLEGKDISELMEYYDYEL